MTKDPVLKGDFFLDFAGPGGSRGKSGALSFLVAKETVDLQVVIEVRGSPRTSSEAPYVFFDIRGDEEPFQMTSPRSDHSTRFYSHLKLDPTQARHLLDALTRAIGDMEE
jgi:hypothetical protein